MEAFAKRLRELRGERTQAEVAEKLGLKPSTYTSYENSICEPSMANLIKMADFYNVSLDTLFGRESVKDSFTKGFVAGHLVSLQIEIKNSIDEVINEIIADGLFGKETA